MFQRLKALFFHTAIYGVGDVATSLLNFLLLPVYTRYLTPTEYGVITLLIVLEAVSKILFRWGVDSAFLRLYYDCTDDRARQRLTSTIFFFMLAANSVVVLAAMGGASTLGEWLLGTREHTNLLRLVLLNTFVISFFFLPYSLLRIQERSKPAAVLAFSRSAAVLVSRLLLVVGAGLGVWGIVLADIIVSALFALVAAKWVLSLLRLTFSRAVIREALHFGLPRLPHGLAHNAIALSDRYLLSVFATVTDVGMYAIGATFSLALKLFLGAFGQAWGPFFLGVMKQPQPEQIYRSVTTYVLAIEVLLVAGLSAVGGDLIRLMTTPEFYDAAAVIPWIALGVLFQGFYQLTSVGLSITKQTRYYPVATGLAAATSITANVVLIPRFGVLGAAWANALSYLVLATVALYFSQKFYPIPYEWARLARIASAAAVAYLVATMLVPVTVVPVVGLFARGILVVIGYAIVLWLQGFFRPTELDRLRQELARFRQRSVRGPRVHQEEPWKDHAEMAGEIVATSSAVSSSEPDD